MTNEEVQIIELHFPIQGETLPSDHAYYLYSAISNLVPGVHNASWLGIHTIQGRRLRPGVIKIGKLARLRLRLPICKVSEIYKLAGATIDIGGHLIRLGVPELHMLKPTKKLRSRFVMIKCKDSKGKSAEPESFLVSLKKQISDLGVSADVELEENVFSPREHDLTARRVMRVKSAKITGFGVILDNLSDQDSLLVQAVGLGGKRRMGCGLFESIDSGD